MSFPIVYDPAMEVARGPQPGAVALRDWILANYPILGNLGIYAVRNVRGKPVLSVHAEGRAIDIGTPSETAPTEAARKVGADLAGLLVQNHAELGVQVTIFDRFIWSAVKNELGWRSYTGTNPHVGHVHIELNRAAAAQLTTDMILEALGGEMPTTNDDRIRNWQVKLAEAGHAHHWRDGTPIDPTNPTQLAEYADGTFGKQTEADSIEALQDGGAEVDDLDLLEARAALGERVLDLFDAAAKIH